MSGITVGVRRCERKTNLDGTGWKRCLRLAVWEYLVDPDGGLSERPHAFICERHIRPVPTGYLRRRFSA